MKLGVLTAYTGSDWDDLAGIVIPNFQEYCTRWGYEFHLLHGNYADASWHYPWQKTLWARDLIKSSDADAFWVLDLDVLITNFTIPVHSFLDDEHSIFMARDVSGHLNCGSYLVKNNENALLWMDSIMSLREELTSEQHAVIHLSESPLWKLHTKELTHPSLNSVAYDLYDVIGRKDHEEGQWQNSDLLVHLPGMTPQRRYEILKDYVNWVVREDA